MYKKIIEYKTLEGSIHDDLDVLVNEHIKEGWQPYGYQLEDDCTYRYQVMVKFGGDL